MSEGRRVSNVSRLEIEGEYPLTHPGAGWGMKADAWDGGGTCEDVGWWWGVSLMGERAP